MAWLRFLVKTGPGVDTIIRLCWYGLVRIESGWKWMAWVGIGWYGLIWVGMGWYGLVWFGIG